MRVRYALGLIGCASLFAVLLPFSQAGQVESNPSEFDRQAFSALPTEESYSFQRALAESTWHPRRDPAAQPTDGEFAIPPSGWTIIIKSDAREPLRQAAQDLHDYLDTAMGTHVTLQPAQSLVAVNAKSGAIVAGARRDLPGCGASLTGSKDYQIIAGTRQVLVCGYDELGAMYGLYNLEERMDLREAPFLPHGLNTVRHSLFRSRMTLSGLGWMEWPDKYLATLARYGFDSIFASPYANPNGAAAPVYYADLPMSGAFRFHIQDPARVHDLARRAAQYGIRLYCPIMYNYTGTPENVRGLEMLVRDTVREFPEIRGYVVLTEGFYYKTWFWAGGQRNIDLHEWTRGWGQGVALVAEVCHKLNPAIEVLPWAYSIDFRPSMVDINRYVIDQLPADVIPLVTFENGKGFSLDGQHAYLRDYSISQTGPAEVATAQITEAKKRHLPAVYAKADTWASWQLGTFPYLPFPYQWYDRYQALEKSGIDGTMESWTYGFKPNFVAEMRDWYCWSDAPPLDDLLRQIARRDFGKGSEDDVLAAWKHFSAAIRLDPDTGPTSGGNNAIGNPLFFQQPASHIMTLKHGFFDYQRWMEAADLNPYWPYAVREYFLYPDFSDKTNVAEQYAKPFTLSVFEKYLGLAADEMASGLQSYRRAALNAPASKRPNAYREVLLAEQIERMFRSNDAVLEFEDLRFHLATAKDLADRARMLGRMTEILQQEMVRTQASLETSRRDSRLGYEWEQDYFYWPEVLARKLAMLKTTLNEEIPAYRQSH